MLLPTQQNISSEKLRPQTVSRVMPSLLGTKLSEVGSVRFCQFYKANDPPHALRRARDTSASNRGIQSPVHSRSQNLRASRRQEHQSVLRPAISMFAGSIFQ